MESLKVKKEHEILSAEPSTKLAIGMRRPSQTGLTPSAGFCELKPAGLVVMFLVSFSYAA